MQTAVNLTKVGARDKLPPRKAPYWQTLKTGLQLGYLKLTPTATPKWQVQWRDAGTGEQVRRSLGALDTFKPEHQHDEAKRLAEELAQHLGSGGTRKPRTVQDICADYLRELAKDKGAAAMADAEARFKRWVYPTSLAGIEVAKLNRSHVQAWRSAMEGQTVALSKGQTARAGQARSGASLNRDLSPLRAALNLAKERGEVSTDAAWVGPLKPVTGVGGRRGLYLDRDQRQRLITAATPELKPFVTALALLPLRPGALAALNVGDFDAKQGMLTVRTDKAGAGRKLPLPSGMVALLVEQSRDKLPAASLFTRAGGKRWDKDAWKGPLKAAAEAAGLPPETVAYSLRHAAITDLVVGGLDLNTVAKLSGTSLLMIDKHYGQLRQDIAVEALARLAL